MNAFQFIMLSKTLSLRVFSCPERNIQCPAYGRFFLPSRRNFRFNPSYVSEFFPIDQNVGSVCILFPLQYKSCCIRRRAGLFSKTCLDYKTCHTNYSKTRLKYRTQQLSVDVTMTSSLLSSKKKRFKTRVQ